MFFGLDQEQYMTIYLALNEEFKAPVQVLKVPDFKEKVKSVTDDRPANHIEIRKEFEVHKIIQTHYLQCFTSTKYKSDYQCITFVNCYFNLKGIGYLYACLL